MTAVPLIKPARCLTCKYREAEQDGTHRCHFGPPQRSAVPVVQPDGKTIIHDTVGFPQVLDDWSCAQHKAKLAVLN